MNPLEAPQPVEAPKGQQNFDKSAADKTAQSSAERAADYFREQERLKSREMDQAFSMRDSGGINVDELIPDYTAALAREEQRDESNADRQSVDGLVSDIVTDPEELQRRADAKKSPTEQLLNAVARASRPTDQEATAMKAAGIDLKAPETIAAKVDPKTRKTLLERIFGSK